MVVVDQVVVGEVGEVGGGIEVEFVDVVVVICESDLWYLVVGFVDWCVDVLQQLVFGYQFGYVLVGVGVVEVDVMWQQVLCIVCD